MPAGSDNEVYWHRDENLFRWNESPCHVPHFSPCEYEVVREYCLRNTLQWLRSNVRWLSSQSVAKKEGSSSGGERVLEQGSLWVKRGCSVFSLLAF